MATIKLLDAVSTDTIGTGVAMDGSGRVLTVYGDNLGGGTISLDISDDNGVHWVPVTYNASPLLLTSFTSREIVRLAQGQLIRASLTGSTGASNVTVAVSN